MFITFEGTEGSGKTTQIKAAYAVLRDDGYRVTLTREPGGTAIGDQIRTILLDNLKNTNMQARAELLLFCASRAQLVGELIRPTIEQGGILLCDRYSDSTLAYQGYGHGLPIADLKQILTFATAGLVPDVTIYLDIKPEKGLERRRRGMIFNHEDWNRLDAMELAFHQRVYSGYQQIISDSAERFEVIDADRSIEAVQADVQAALRARLTQVTPKS
jgi:dTMP kinase